ncbi:hypothetical protein V6N12_005792 [Hibiscus sabdariffa]
MSGIATLQLPPKVKDFFTAKPTSFALFRLRLGFIEKGVVELSRLCLKCGSLVTDANQVFTAATPTLAAFDTAATVSEVRVEPFMGASNDVALGACCFLICFRGRQIRESCKPHHATGLKCNNNAARLACDFIGWFCHCSS